MKREDLEKIIKESENEISNIGAEVFVLRAKMKRAKERLKEYKEMLEKENFREKKDEESR